MSSFSKPWLRNALLVLGGAGVVGMAWVSLAQILKVDAFAKFGPTGVPVGAEAGVTLTNFRMKAYEGGRLAAEAVMDGVEVRRDRSQMAMTGVRDGKFYESGGETYSFDMPSATFHYFQDRLSAEKGAHVVGKDIDLTSDKFNYDKTSKTLLVRGTVQGELHGGAVKADDLTIVSSSKSLSANNIRWIGEVELEQDGQRRQWDIDGKHMSRSADGKTDIYTKVRATDGEIIVIADKGEYTRETDVLVATGNVRYWGVDANMTCDTATVYRKERRAVMTGVVRMMIKSEDDEKVVESEIPAIERVTKESLKTNPQGATEEQIKVLRDSDNIRKFPIKVVSDKIEYWYKKGERRAVITGSPFARQDFTDGWRIGWAVEAFYDGETEKLTLKSKAVERDVIVMNSIGDVFNAVDIVLSTKEGDHTFDGNNIGAIYYDSSDEDPPRNTGGGTGGGATTGGSTAGR